MAEALGFEKIRTLNVARDAVFARVLRQEDRASLRNERFTALLAQAVDGFGVEPAAISSAFGVTSATVSRWKNGEARPVPYVRNEVIKWIADALETRVTESAGKAPRWERVVEAIEGV